MGADKHLEMNGTQMKNLTIYEGKLFFNRVPLVTKQELKLTGTQNYFAIATSIAVIVSSVVVAISSAFDLYDKPSDEKIVGVQEILTEVKSDLKNDITINMPSSVKNELMAQIQDNSELATLITKIVENKIKQSISVPEQAPQL